MLIQNLKILVIFLCLQAKLQLFQIMGLSTLCAQKTTKFFTHVQYVEGVYTIQNGAYESNGLTAYSVGGHDMVLNWMTDITDSLQFYVVSVKFGSDDASREVILSFWSLKCKFFLPHKKI